MKLGAYSINSTRVRVRVLLEKTPLTPQTARGPPRRSERTASSRARGRQTQTDRSTVGWRGISRCCWRCRRPFGRRWWLGEHKRAVLTRQRYAHTHAHNTVCRRLAECLMVGKPWFVCLGVRMTTLRVTRPRPPTAEGWDRCWTRSMSPRPRLVVRDAQPLAGSPEPHLAEPLH